jgi:hypothetical protein
MSDASLPLCHGCGEPEPYCRCDEAERCPCCGEPIYRYPPSTAAFIQSMDDLRLWKRLEHAQRARLKLVAGALDK